MKSCVIALCALVFAAPPAQAHAFLDHAMPAVGGTVATPPKALHLFYTEGVVPHFSRVTVRDNGQPIAVGPLRNGRDARELIVPLPKPTSGDYAVHWHVTSVDTHKTQGGFHFVVAP